AIDRTDLPRPLPLELESNVFRHGPPGRRRRHPSRESLPPARRHRLLRDSAGTLYPPRGTAAGRHLRGSVPHIPARGQTMAAVLRHPPPKTPLSRKGRAVSLLPHPSQQGNRDSGPLLHGGYRRYRTTRRVASSTSVPTASSDSMSERC